VFFSGPLALQSLDLSFNHLSSFSDVLICSQLVTLQLHGNPIRDWREVAILSQLTKLSKLTLHGSPIEQQPGYRRIALATVKPLRLRQLDFSTVTAAELAEALQSSQPGPPFVIPLRHSPSPSLMARSSVRRASPALSRAERLARYTELSRPVGRYSGEFDQEALQQSPGAIGRQRRSRSRFSLSPERARHLAKLSRPKKLF
jgi:Leucine-rich repeat (LRR) protein